jgi:RNA polymerase sigma factor (sigma-70 family)
MTSIRSPMDDSLANAVALATAGDEAAFERIVRAHHADMTRVCFVICGDLDLADEAVGAAWSIVWRRLGTLRDPGRLRAWLVTVAANEARQLMRRQRRRAVVELSVAGSSDPRLPDPEGSAADIDLANALARLAPDDRALLALRYVAGLNSTELARASGRSASGTRARLARLLERLRTELDDD